MEKFRPKEFISQVIKELKSVTWPTRENTISTSIVVVVVVGLITVYLGVVDFIVSKLARLLIG